MNELYVVRAKTSDGRELFYKRGGRFTKFEEFGVCSLFNKGGSTKSFNDAKKLLRSDWEDPKILWDTIELLKVNVSLSPVTP